MGDRRDNTGDILAFETPFLMRHTQQAIQLRCGDVDGKYDDCAEADYRSHNIDFSMEIGHDGDRGVFHLLREIPSNPAVRHHCQA